VATSDSGATRGQPDSVVAVAGEGRDGKRVAWLANLTDRIQVIVISGAAEMADMDVWDEENFADPLVISLQTTSTKNVLSVQLRPYAVAYLRDSSK